MFVNTLFNGYEIAHFYALRTKILERCFTRRLKVRLFGPSQWLWRGKLFGRYIARIGPMVRWSDAVLFIKGTVACAVMRCNVMLPKRRFWTVERTSR